MEEPPVEIKKEIENPITEQDGEDLSSVVEIAEKMEDEKIQESPELEEEPI